MEKEYIMAFSSFYKAAYAQDMLSEAGIKAQLKRLPQELVRSCGTGVYLRTSDIGEDETDKRQRRLRNKTRRKRNKKLYKSNIERTCESRPEGVIPTEAACFKFFSI